MEQLQIIRDRLNEKLQLFPPVELQHTGNLVTIQAKDIRVDLDLKEYGLHSPHQYARHSIDKVVADCVTMIKEAVYNNWKDNITPTDPVPQLLVDVESRDTYFDPWHADGCYAGFSKDKTPKTTRIVDPDFLRWCYEVTREQLERNQQLNDRLRQIEELVKATEREPNESVP